MGVLLYRPVDQLDTVRTLADPERCVQAFVVLAPLPCTHCGVFGQMLVKYL